MNQISKDYLDRHQVALFWCGLEYCTHTHTQNNIRSGCTKIDQRTNHRAIKFLIHILTLRIEIKINLSWHGSLGTFDLIKLVLLEHVLNVFGLVDEGPLPQLIDFNSKEELQLSHHKHLEAVGHELGKILIKSF